MSTRQPREASVDESAAEGWIVLGDDRSYRTVLVPARSDISLPARVGVTLRTADPVTGHQVGGGFRVEYVPTYPAGADPKTVRYGYDVLSERDSLLTPEEIRQRTKCAREYAG